MSDVIRAALAAHRLRSQTVGGLLAVRCVADGCAWSGGEIAIGAVVDDLHDALVAVTAAHITHQAEVATVAVLEVTEGAVYDAFSSGPPLQAHDIVHAIAAALAGEG